MVSRHQEISHSGQCRFSYHLGRRWLDMARVRDCQHLQTRVSKTKHTLRIMERSIFLNPYFFQIIAPFPRDRKYILSTSGRPPSPWERWERSGRGSYRHISSSPGASPTISRAPPQHLQPPTLPISFPFFFCQGLGKHSLMIREIDEKGGFDKEERWTPVWVL